MGRSGSSGGRSSGGSFGGSRSSGGRNGGFGSSHRGGGSSGGFGSSGGTASVDEELNRLKKELGLA